MPAIIAIPARAILDQKDAVLRLEHPRTCSRCGRTPAELFETHQLKLRAGLKHNPLPGRRYRLEHSYQLKIPLCARCYQLDYLQAPESLASDPTPLGHLSRLQEFLRGLGGITAGLGLLLFTPFIPATAAFASAKANWWIPLSAGVGLILLGLFSQVTTQTRLRRVLDAAGELEPELIRAEVRTPLYAAPEDVNQVALQVKLVDEQWARECAVHYHYAVENLEE